MVMVILPVSVPPRRCLAHHRETGNLLRCESNAGGQATGSRECDHTYFVDCKMKGLVNGVSVNILVVSGVCPITSTSLQGGTFTDSCKITLRLEVPYAV